MKKELIEMMQREINMAKAIANITGTDIERLDAQTHRMKGLDPWIVTVVDYSDGRQIGIRSDCTIIDYNNESRDIAYLRHEA